MTCVDWKKLKVENSVESELNEQGPGDCIVFSFPDVFYKVNGLLHAQGLYFVGFSIFVQFCKNGVGSLTVSAGTKVNIHCV